jgi:hypothetical protein
MYIKQHFFEYFILRIFAAAPQRVYFCLRPENKAVAEGFWPCPPDFIESQSEMACHVMSNVLT